MIDADKQLHHTKNSLSGRFFGLLVIVTCLMLATTVGLARIFVPSPGEIMDLRSTVANLERRGGKIQFSNCGDARRLCVKNDVDANKSKGGFGVGKDDNWMIPQGY
ncbi:MULTISPECIES: hypothetical protein [Pseudomonas syringae group]|uniref:hypothetical protein n=1 Tax=Pseudomonas syringae group TaxID=136849 RepID=UPI0006D6319E|nr:hypothetical protein [Pseudomonas meliae]KPW71287.1 hypothetical protein ALO78_200261 [Pseudomonas amygdali pv. ciccaronei]